MKNEYLELEDGVQYPEHIHYFSDGRSQRQALLNGKKVEKAVYADTEKGIIIIAAVDENGKIKWSRETGDIEYEKLEGRVTIEFPKDDK